MWFKLFVWVTAVVQACGVALIIIMRCQLDDAIDCSDVEGKSFSWLLDWSWIQTFSAVLLGGAAFVNVWFAFGLLYPCYKHPYDHWYIWLVRVLHAAGFIGVAMVGVFDLNEHQDAHMSAAFFLFIALSLECILVLFIPENRCNVQKLFRCKKMTEEEDKIWTMNNYRIWFSLQILHALLIPTFAVLYVVTDIGPFEWVSIWLIVFYYIWFSRDHQDDMVHTDLVDHPTCPELSYGQFKLMKIQSLQTYNKRHV